jgi:DNA modification methylase
MSEPWKAKRQIGDCTLYLGDCLDILPILPKDGAIVTDPPYGMGWNTDSTRFTGGMRKRAAGRDDWDAIREDSTPFDPSPWLDFKSAVLWGANHYAQRLPVGKTLVWIKKHPDLFGTFLSDCEIGWASGGHGVFAHYKQFPPPSRMAESNGLVAHPTQKPISLMTWCVQTFARKGTVIDPYMGSGTTGVACVRLGRGFIGIEAEERYFRTACKRIAEANLQPDLFVEKPAAPEQETLL